MNLLDIIETHYCMVLILIHATDTAKDLCVSYVHAGESSSSERSKTYASA